MTFWEILYNVVAFLWSPAAISAAAFVIAIVLWGLALDRSNYYGYGLQVTLSGIGAGIIAVLGIAFTLWWIQAGLNPGGWHYPLSTQR